MDTLSVAMWATNLEVSAVSLEAWVGFVEAKMMEFSSSTPQILALPEFACMQWLSFSPPGLTVPDQLPWLAAQAVEALVMLRPLAARYNVALLPGTMPHALIDEKGSTRYANRAWLFLPDGREVSQDKLCLTPSEMDPQGWLLSPGTDVEIIEWAGLRIAILICLDVEFTSLWARLGKLDLDLILIPAKTGLISGYYRVFSCAYARATELQTVVCVVGAVGTPGSNPATDVVMGGACAYVPCDGALGYTGIAAALGPHAAASGLSPILIAHDLPVGYCRKMRHGAAEAEVWPSSWSADHVIINDPAAS
ncbi:nitrilase-related carbon-nitrogen hydrolase [Labrys sp. KB_33_2]|uniref:nitrilase-related carbon-nitrogen hydrolase n=1 Tax=Labrys sp. KB_33_2 TaxID=3237479 RepID=UPI003F8DFC8D